MKEGVDAAKGRCRWERSARRATRRRTRRTCTSRSRSSIPTNDGGEGPRSIHFWSGAIPPRTDAGVSRLSYFSAKQYKYPLPPVATRFGPLQPLLRVRRIPRRVAAAGAVEVTDLRAPVELLVQLLQVRSSPAGNARPRCVEPVRMSCWFSGFPSGPISPAPSTIVFFSVSAVVFDEVAAELRELDRVAVQVRDIARDDAAA